MRQSIAPLPLSLGLAVQERRWLDEIATVLGESLSWIVMTTGGRRPCRSEQPWFQHVLQSVSSVLYVATSYLMSYCLISVKFSINIRRGYVSLSLLKVLVGRKRRIEFRQKMFVISPLGICSAVYQTQESKVLTAVTTPLFPSQKHACLQVNGILIYKDSKLDFFMETDPDLLTLELAFCSRIGYGFAP